MLGAGRGFARRSGWRGAFVYAACLAVSGTLQEEASAASWTLERGSAQVITTFTYDIATAAFGNDGGLVPVPKFEKMNVGIHAEYGVLDNLTLRLLPSYEFVDTGFSGERNREQGLNSTGAGARYRLWSGSRQVISVESTYYTKGALRTNETTVLSRGSGDVDVRLLYGMSRDISVLRFRANVFSDVQAGYRFRDGAPPNEYHVDVTFGAALPGRRWQLLGQTFSIVSDGEGELDGEAQFDAFELHKAQVSTVYELTDRIAIQVGGFTTLYGRNIIQEQAGFGALWVTF